MINKFLGILDKKNQRKIFYLLALYIPLNLIEAFSISSIPGFIVLISDPTKVKEFFPNLQYIDYLINLDLYSRSILGTVLLAIIFLFRSLFIIFVNWYDFSLRYEINVQNSKKLYTSYLYKPYIFHINNNSSNLIQNMNDSLRSTSAIFSFLNILKDLILLLLIVITILIASPLNLVYLFLFIIIPMIILFFLVKNIIKNLGSLARNNRVFSHKSMSEGFLNIKFLKIKNIYDRIINDFYQKHAIAQKNESKLLIINSFPRLILEFLSLLFILTFITINIKSYSSIIEIIPIVTLVVVASVRLIPSFSQISINISNIKFNQTTLKKINTEILEWKKNYEDNIEKSKKNIIKSFKNKLEVSHLSFSYDKNKNLIEELSFEIKKGEKVVFSGRSGAGKTTLSDIVLGLLKPNKGNIFCDGINISDDIYGWRKQLSYTPQNIILYDGSIKDNICFNLNNREINEKLYQKALKISGLDEILYEFTERDNTNVGYLSSKISGGQKQRIGIARAIYQNKPIIVLDEATNSLDKDSEDKIISNLFKEEHTIIVITHSTKIQKLCDKNINLDDKKTYKHV